ncbi:ABC transporter substrate-binding protein [Mumia sp. DW29H23]|uniref:ABC transporter substrate-binding protein n=1 Tax=Mumia sp. DW29H23 TaxID=3421241 RepID=UPI003D68910C
MTRRSVRTLAAAASLALLATVAGCGGDSDSASGSETQTVKVGTLRGQPHFYAPFLYEDGDGVDYEVVTLDTTPALNDALVSGQVDVAITGITATIASDAQGRDLTVVASAADGGSGFVGNDDVKTVADLAGKKLGYLVGSAQEVALRLTLEEAGVSADDVELVSLKAPEFFNAFKTGQIDAFFGPEIGVSLALGAGGHEITSPYDTAIAKLNIALVTTGALIESDPELVQKVVDMHTATTESMSDTQDEWLKEMVTTYGGDQAVFETALENFWLRADLPQDYQDQIQALIDSMSSLGLVDEAPELSAVVDPSFAEKAS